MAAYLIRRILLSVRLLIGIATTTFVFVHLAPGDPMDTFLDPQRFRQYTPDAVKHIREKFFSVNLGWLPASQTR